MVKTPQKPRSGCPINFGLEIFGDKWSLLVLRDVLLQGKSSFKAFQQSEERIASNVLAERLARLERAGLLRREVHKEDARQLRYLPTNAARKLLPALVELAYWGATHDAKTAAPSSFVHAYKNDKAALLQSLERGAIPSRD